MPDTLAITLRGMRFHTLVGVLPHEGEHAQPLEVDLTVWCDAPVGDAAPLDYRELYALTAKAVARDAIGYLEHFAGAVCDGAFAHDRVTRVRVAVRKPHVALPGPLDAAEVVLERTR